MKFPVIFHIGLVVIDAHFVFEVLSYFIGFQYYQYLRRKSVDLLTLDQRISVIVGAIFGAACGSKILGYFEHQELFSLAKQNMAYIFASKTIVGGLLGGIIGVEFAKKIIKLSTPSGDLFCFPIILGMMIGRIGCFLAGVGDRTWGTQTNFIFAMDGGDGVYRHPVPLYEIVFLGVVWITILQFKHNIKLKNGAMFKLFIFMYLMWRFLIENIKDVYLIPGLGISAIQLACLLGVCYYYKVMFDFKCLRDS